jgi:hypothetical protein
MSYATATHRGVDGEGSRAADRLTPRAWTKEEDLILREAVSECPFLDIPLFWCFRCAYMHSNPSTSSRNAPHRPLFHDPDFPKS